MLEVSGTYDVLATEGVSEDEGGDPVAVVVETQLVVVRYEVIVIYDVVVDLD